MKWTNENGDRQSVQNLTKKMFKNLAKNIFIYPVHLLLVHLRPLLIAELEGVTHGPLLGSLHGGLHELVIDALFNHETRRGAASLAHVEEEAVVRRLHRLLDVSVRQHDGRVLATQLQGDALDAVGSRPLDDLPHLSGASERHLVHIRVGSDGGSRRVTIAWNQRELEGGKNWL